MTIFRTAMLIMICLGLAMHGTHALALCMDGDGSLALELVVDGACAGSSAGSNTRAESGQRTSAAGLGRSAEAVGLCGGCTDVVLGGGSVAISPSVFSGKYKSARRFDGAVDLVDVPRSLTLRAPRAATLSSYAPISERPPTHGSVVLRL
ncbi:hypothetical protein K8S17_07105 [bacterium]|nr:hypothetical protein [bacterium]